MVRSHYVFHLVLSYLSSYEGMGMARLTCCCSCTCAPTLIDAHRGAEASPRDVSVWEDQRVQFSIPTQAESYCDLLLTVENRTRSSGHKFKMKGVTFRRDVR